MKCLGVTPDHHAARSKWRQHVVDDERHIRVALSVLEFGSVSKVLTSDVDGVERQVVTPAQRDQVRHAGLVDGGKTTKLSFAQVGQLCLGEGAHVSRISTVLGQPGVVTTDGLVVEIFFGDSRPVICTPYLDDGYLDNVIRRMILLSTTCYLGAVNADGRPEALETWTKICDVVDGVRVSVNRELQREVGLTLAENLVLCQVAMAPDSRLRMVDIAGLLGIAKSAVTKTVDRLERRGLVARRREPADQDRRIVYASLTDEGAKVFADAQPTFVAAVTQHVAEPLTEDELHQLGRISEKLLSSGARPPGDRSPRGDRDLPRGQVRTWSD